MGERAMKVLTTAILSVALGTTTVSPAQADSDDLAKAILGIAAVAIIAKSVDDRKDRRRANAREAEATVGASRLGSLERPHAGRTLQGTISRFDRHGPKPRRGYKKTPLPQSCLRIVNTLRGERVVYGARCLDRNFRFASKLPDRCEIAVRTNRGVRTVYGERCLRREGWNIARR